MAQRRMFAKSIVLSGPFIRLSAKAQLLYFHLGMLADDDGFASAPELAIRAAGATNRELNQLVAAGFLLRFSSGLLVIRHWFLHNSIKKDRFRPTVYQKELQQLFLNDGVYEQVPDWNQNGSKAEPQIKQKEIKQNQMKSNQPNITPGSGAMPGSRGDGHPALAEILCYCIDKGYTANAGEFFAYYQERNWMENGRPVYDWKRLLKKWEEQYAGTS